jgi:hypothetical protein
MSKKAPKQRKAKATARPIQAVSAGKTRWEKIRGSLTVRTIVLIFAAIGAINSATEFWHRVAPQFLGPQVRPSAFDSTSPFDLHFSVSNETWFRMSATTFSCAIDTLEMEDGKSIRALSIAADPATTDLIAGETKLYVCPVPAVFSNLSPVRNATFGVRVTFYSFRIPRSYSSPLYHWNRSEQRFQLGTPVN